MSATPQMLRSILLPLDGSHLSERAIPCAATLARAAGSRLVTLRATAVDAGAPHLAETAQREAGEYLAAVARQLREYDGIADVAVVTVAGEPAQAIVTTAAERGCDAIVMATHGRGGLGRWLYGSVADQVMRHAPVPVVLVPASCPHPWSPLPAGGPDAPRRVLVPLDGSDLAQSAVATAAGAAQALDADVHLLQVVEPPRFAYAAGYTWTEVDPASLLHEAGTYLEGIASTLRARGLRVSVVTELGYAAPAIAAAARERGADLVVMATHGRSGVARAVLGSVATELLHQSPVPVMLVRPVRHQGFPRMPAPPAAATLNVTSRDDAAQAQRERQVEVTISEDR